ncbi:NAD(P)-binding Rossmann-fold superfamily protein [Thalictrum thalictroides]|uniref:NAD(P)-binding Rossmann-fold superfamily protein n=1 Tax=Thalictrum thalictroides TaxID=46969 RepID=A0A7J6WFT6_THATH|nr:NAD(P)-binding Rossmann-fold superfamily protein [Thalictrum thalictroides]
MIETAEEIGIEGRIINVSSVVHSWIRREGFNFNTMLNPKNYNGTDAYAQSKLANILHTKELAKRLEGASTACYVSLSSKVIGVNGKYFADCNESSCSVLANDEPEAQKLWKQTQELMHSQLH